MLKIDKALKSEDVSTILFYIDNTDLIIEMHEKRGLCTKALDDEKRLLINRYRELTGKNYKEVQSF